MLRMPLFRLRVVLFSVCLASASLAEVTPDQRTEIEALKGLLSNAGSLYRQGKAKDAGKVVAEVQQRVDTLAGDPTAELLSQMNPIFNGLKSAHVALELEGVKLPPLKIPTVASTPAPRSTPRPQPRPTPKPNTPNTPEPAPASTGTSFVKEVAPILLAKCGRCHVSKASGMLSLANFALIERGHPTAGLVIFPGDASGSPLIAVIEDGDMPRGGLKITPQELATLKKWIDEGAKYDGGNKQVPLVKLSNVASSQPVPVAPVPVHPTGRETVSFARDIAPVLVANCDGCHVGSGNPRGNLNMDTFERLMRGGDSGAPVVPGNPADSLLVGKLKGTAGGQRMPAGGRAHLGDAVMTKIETWIREGATFDGPNAGDPLTAVAALAKARNSTHEELSVARAEQAWANWKLGMPGIAATQEETENFLLIGNLGENSLAELGEQAEAVTPEIATMLGAPSGQPLVKGRITIYIFDQRYDYSEFGKMVEKRDLPKQWRGHWRFNTVDAYGALVRDRSDSYDTRTLIAQQIAGTYVGSLGKNTPHWFADGSARATAAALNGSDSRVVKWDEELGNILGTMQAADDFLTGKLAPESADICAYSFVKFLQGGGNKSKYSSLLNALRNGEDFNAAFSKAFGGSPNQLATVWARGAARKR